MELTVDDLLGLCDATDDAFDAWLRAERRPQVSWIHYASDGWPIEAILVRPTGDARAPLPTLVFLHGGPEQRNDVNAASLAAVNGESAALWLASHGYAVLLPNYRGSTGYGQAFCDELQDYQLMHKPCRDVLAGVEHLVAEGLADGDRLGVYGCSFGAQLAAWVLAHSDCFRAGVLACGRYDTLLLDRCCGTAFHALRANRQGAAGPLDMWLRPEVYEHLSPLHHVATLNTPALIVETGAERKDLQARLLFNALQARQVAAHWVYYPAAFHTGRWPAACQRDYLTRLLAWWDHHLRGATLPELFAEAAVTVTAEAN